MKASGQSGIPELRKHSPLSAFDRDMERIKLHLNHKQNLLRVAIGAGVAIGLLLMTVGALSVLELVSLRIAGLTLGAGAMLVGLTRWLINASVHRARLAAAKRLQPLTHDEVAYLHSLAEHSLDLQVELDIWNVLSDELSKTELELAQKWSSRRHSDVRRQ
ncbi:hypothetical protein IPT12_15030 [Xanthomonas perforans]|uniref:Uncharacterized protein n=3 Tax=Xanthomonas perforans TaxID=442694 RepID=A0A6P0FJB7_XANPE|nr:hypothetical protein [Xanthomonas perforans]KLC44480.1 hypothetical protein XP1712_15075 [Xanthomonas perforans]MBZ2413749.1 hypothetical protein [Xanthomonas perforans]MBZ2422143.1 hypothetical protein [Xanthomonas perforans]MBZ2426399.1 hypothetical protein [Xanthomonas perforans]MBZ2430855.1 hypothetical protein [Xanthomonas perforans]